MFTAALFTLAELWKLPRCLIAGECIVKMCYLHAVTFYLATKKNLTLSFAGKWMELENIILSAVSQVEKDKNCMFFLICGI
jgi:hypothetical protein